MNMDHTGWSHSEVRAAGNLEPRQFDGAPIQRGSSILVGTLELG